MTLRQTPASAMVACLLWALGPASQAADPLPAVPAALIPPGAAHLKTVMKGLGYQIYHCQADGQDAGGYAWTLVAPDAMLVSGAGDNQEVLGRHYAGPTWEANDGSKVTAKVSARSPAPDRSAVPWLLLEATVVQPGSTFAQVAWIQRLYTQGGAVPVLRCNAESVDLIRRVPYRADYYFFTAN